MSRILHISKFYPPDTGGMESIVRELVAGLGAVGWGSDVLCAGRHWRSAEETHPEGYRIVRAGSLGTWLSTSLSVPLLLRTRRLADQYDLIHVHMPNPLAALALWFARPRARLVVHWHSDVVRQQRALRLYEPLQRWLLARADAIIATSQRYLDASTALAEWRHKVCVIPLGIGDNAGRSDAQSVEALRRAHPGKRLVFSLGRMVGYKGFDTLIDAAALLPDNAVVVIGGAGPLLDTYRARVSASGLDAKVFLPGPIDDDELMNYHRAADVFCLPSVNRAEAFGVSVLEAMSAARPVVCSDLAGSALPWVNQNGVTGLTVAPGEPAPLARALTRLLADPALARAMGKAARARFLHHFAASAMIEQVAALYRRLLTD